MPSIKVNYSLTKVAGGVPPDVSVLAVEDGLGKLRIDLDPDTAPTKKTFPWTVTSSELSNRYSYRVDLDYGNGDAMYHLIISKDTLKKDTYNFSISSTGDGYVDAGSTYNINDQNPLPIKDKTEFSCTSSDKLTLDLNGNYHVGSL